MKRTALASLTCLLLTAPVSAEVSVTRLTAGGVEFFFQPGPGGPWEPVRTHIPLEDMLNVDGDLAGDSWPVILENPATGLPDVVWSSGGDNREILFSWHDGAIWHEALNLSQAAGNDELPALGADAYGNRFVAWTRAHNGRGTMLFTALSADGQGQTSAYELSDRNVNACRGVLGVHDTGEVFVAYEEAHNGNNPTVYLAIDHIDVERGEDGMLAHSGERPIDIARSLSVQTAAAPGQPLDPLIHIENGRLWVDWIDSAYMLGWTEWVDGAFTAPQLVPIEEAGNDQDARDQVRNEVLD